MEIMSAMLLQWTRLDEKDVVEQRAIFQDQHDD